MSRGCSSHRRRHPGQVFTGARHPRAASAASQLPPMPPLFSRDRRHGDAATMPLSHPYVRAHIGDAALSRRLWRRIPPSRPALSFAALPLLERISVTAATSSFLPAPLPFPAGTFARPSSSAGRCRAARCRSPLSSMRITHCRTPFPCPFLLSWFSPRETPSQQTRTHTHTTEHNACLTAAYYTTRTPGRARSAACLTLRRLPSSTSWTRPMSVSWWRM